MKLLSSVTGCFSKGGTKVGVTALVLLSLLVLRIPLPCEAAMDSERLDFELGPVLPRGENISDYYGSIWVGLKANYRLADDENSGHGLTLSISGGYSDITIPDWPVDTVRTSAARLFGLRYTYTRDMFGPIFVGAGAGAYLVNTEARYDAGEGYVWSVNGERYLSISKTSAAFAPHVTAGYKHSDRLSIVLDYSIFGNTALAGNTSGYAGLPGVPDSKLNSTLTLSGRFKF